MPGTLEKMILDYPMKPAGKKEMERGATISLLRLSICKFKAATFLIIAFLQ
jgi:hypothetical protein